ncbi:MAG: DUF6178 family protein [Cystobacterineae bacterium]|nr:DUF6178 family protein [Cystobacterineae bacterium]
MDNAPLKLRQIQTLPLSRQADALLENPQALQRFPAEELYGLIRHLGLEDALELLQNTSPAQFCALMDFAAWRGDRLELASLMEWLEAALGEDEEAFFSKLQGLDLEILELIFRRAVHIKPADEPEDPTLEFLEMGEGGLRLEFLLKGNSQHVLRRIAEIWMGKNALEFSRFLEAVRWNLPSESEEAAFSFRNARLEDLGFPPRERAVSLLAWVDVKAYLLAPQEPSLAEAGEDLLEEGFRALSEGERGQLEAQARYLVNAFLVAEGAEPGDSEAIYDLSRQARDYLNLGLHYMTSGKRSLIVKAQQQFGLRSIFQVGLSLTLDLKRELERLRKEPHAQWQKLWWTMDALYPLLSAIDAKRPLLWREGQKTMLKTLADIAFAEAQLEKARRQMAIMAILHRNEPHKALLPFGVELELLRPERFFCSAVAHFVFEGKVLAEPFAPDNVKHLEAKLCVSSFAELAQAFAHAMSLEGAVFEEAKEMALACLHGLRAECDAGKDKRGSLSPQDIFCLPMRSLPLQQGKV